MPVELDRIARADCNGSRLHITSPCPAVRILAWRSRHVSEYERTPPSHLGLLTCVALWLAVSIAGVLAPGCYGQNCEGGAETFGSEVGMVTW